MEFGSSTGTSTGTGTGTSTSTVTGTGTISSTSIRSSSQLRCCRQYKGWRVYLPAVLLLFMFPLASCNRPGPVHMGISSSRTSRRLQSSMLPHRILQDEEMNKLDFPKRPSVQKNDKSRRDLSGLGSSPPQCNSKCGYCTPCRAVHVPIQPGLVRTTEYYPEAWRCKCGNKLYMP